MNGKIRRAIQKDDVLVLENVLANQKCVDLSEYEKDGLTALLFAIENGAKECSKFLICEKKVDVFLKDKNNDENALMKSIQAGNDMLDISRLLMEKNIDIDAKNKEGKTCLHIAGEHNFVKGVEYLIRNNANINITDKEKKTPLMASIKTRSEEAAICLIDNNADVNIKDKHGNSVLHICAKEHLSNIAKYILMTNKVNVEKCIDKEGNSPLHIAAKENMLALCDLLLQYKFDPTLKNKNNETYIEILQNNVQKKMLEKEEKQRNMEERELRKRKKMEAAMENTEVSKFLKKYDIEEFIPIFYQNKYFYMDSYFLNISEGTLKKMKFNNEQIQLIFESIDKHIKETEEQSLEFQLRNQRLIEEQARNKNLKYASVAVSIIFTSLFIYSVVVSLYNKYKRYF